MDKPENRIAELAVNRWLQSRVSVAKLLHNKKALMGTMRVQLLRQVNSLFTQNSQWECQVAKHVSSKSSAYVSEMGDRLATRDMGKKCGAAVPLSVVGTASPSNTMWPGPRPTSVPSGIWIHQAVWPQRTWAENWGRVPQFSN